MLHVVRMWHHGTFGSLGLNVKPALGEKIDCCTIRKTYSRSGLFLYILFNVVEAITWERDLNKFTTATSALSVGDDEPLRKKHFGVILLLIML